MGSRKASRKQRFGRWSKRTAKGALAGAAVGGVVGLLMEHASHFDTHGTASDPPFRKKLVGTVTALGGGAGALFTGLAGLSLT